MMRITMRMVPSDMIESLCEVSGYCGSALLAAGGVGVGAVEDWAIAKVAPPARSAAAAAAFKILLIEVSLFVDHATTRRLPHCSVWDRYLDCVLQQRTQDTLPEHLSS